MAADDDKGMFFLSKEQGTRVYGRIVRFSAVSCCVWHYSL